MFPIYFNFSRDPKLHESLALATTFVHRMLSSIMFCCLWRAITAGGDRPGAFIETSSMGNNMGGKCSTMTCTECSGKHKKCKTKTMGQWARLQTSGRSPSPRSGHDVAVIDNKVNGLAVEGRMEDTAASAFRLGPGFWPYTLNLSKSLCTRHDVVVSLKSRLRGQHTRDQQNFQGFSRDRRC